MNAPLFSWCVLAACVLAACVIVLAWSIFGPGIAKRYNAWALEWEQRRAAERLKDWKPNKDNGRKGRAA